MTRHRYGTAVLLPMFVLLTFAVPPSHAMVRPYMNIDVDYEFGRHKVCADGHVRGASAQIGGSWSLGIVGRRGNGTEINYAAADFGPVFPLTCTYVTKNNTDQGIYHVRLVYIGAGVDCDLENCPIVDLEGGQPYPWVGGGVGLWSPGDNQFITGG